MTQRTTLAVRRHSIFAALTLSLFACSSNSDDYELPSSSSEALPSSSSIPNSLLLNFTSDYATGELRWMFPESASLSNGNISFYNDSKVIASNGQVFVLERPNWGDGILNCIDPQTIGSVNPIQRRLDGGSNPYDIAFAGNKGFIALYGLDYLQTFDAITCTLGEKIDFSNKYTNGASLSANAFSINISGDTLLVVLQRLDYPEATEPGLLLRIKTNGSIIDAIPLKLYNPSSSVLSKGMLYVSAKKSIYDENWNEKIILKESGIEVVNLASGTSEILFDGTVLKGGIIDMALDESAQILYASVYEEWGKALVKPIDLKNKTIGDALPDIVDSFGGLVFDNVGRKLFVGDRGFGSSGLKIYDPAKGKTITAGNQDPLLAPFSLAIARW